MDLKSKKVLVIGAAVTGIPVVRALAEMGAYIILNDYKKEDALTDILCEIKEYDIKFVGGGHPVELAEQCDLAIISPGVPTDIPLVQRLIELGKELIGEIELAYRLTTTPVACITGTNGKTTTTALLGEIMKASKRKTYITGNIGHAMISEVKNAQPEDIFVLEASSFQLDTTKYFKPIVSAILNITPDHLDRHKTMDNYIDAKCKAFINQTENDYTILNADDQITRELIYKPKSKVLQFSRKQILNEGAFIENNHLVISLNGKKEKIIHTDNIYIPGSHNIENALAASLMAYCLGVNGEVIRNVLREFKGVEHRCEFVDEINNVYYYNDSKGTNTDASIKAIEAMKRPIVLIAGGYDKGSDYEDFINAFVGKVKEVVLFGKTAEKIERTAHELGFLNTYRTSSLEEAVNKCYELAKPGECVLLSPACASWDMFRNFEERGRMFKDLVKGLRRA